MNTDCGIYTITSPSGRFYVGSAISFRRRRAEHFKHLKRGTHHNAPLQAAYNKYGKDAIIFQQIIICASDDLLFFEQRPIPHGRAWSACY